MNLLILYLIIDFNFYRSEESHPKSMIYTKFLSQKNRI